MGLGFAEHILLTGRQFLQVGIDVFHRAEAGNQLPGAYLADALHAGHIVGGVAADGQHVDDLHRVQDAPALADGRPVDDFVFAAGLSGLVLEDVRGDQLTVVFVGGDHIDIQRFSGELDGHRPDDVVGLEARQHHHRDAERPDDFGDWLQGVDDQLRGRRARTLVLRVELVAECAARRVEGDGQMGGLFPLDQLQQVLGETVEDGGIGALGIDHRPARKGVVHLENEGVTVYEEEFVHGIIGFHGWIGQG